MLCYALRHLSLFSDDNAPPEKKTLWLACLFLAVPVGYAAGYGYGGIIAPTLGWRAAFVLEGLLMSPFVLFCFCAQPLHLNMKTASGIEGRIDTLAEHNTGVFRVRGGNQRETPGDILETCKGDLCAPSVHLHTFWIRVLYSLHWHRCLLGSQGGQGSV